MILSAVVYIGPGIITLMTNSTKNTFLTPKFPVPSSSSIANSLMSISFKSGSNYNITVKIILSTNILHQTKLQTQTTEGVQSSESLSSQK